MGGASVQVGGDDMAREGGVHAPHDEPHLVSMEFELRVGHSTDPGGTRQSGPEQTYRQVSGLAILPKATILRG